MKRITALMLLLALALSMLACCGSKEITELEKGCYEITDEDGDTVAWFSLGKRLTVLDDDGGILAEDVKLKYDEENKCFTADGKTAFSLLQGDKDSYELTVMKKGTVGLKKGEYIMTPADEDDLPEPEEEEPEEPRDKDMERPAGERPEWPEPDQEPAIEEFVEQDYWQYLRENLLPGYVISGETVEKSDSNTLLGAETADMNGDGVEELLVYLHRSNKIYADLYTKADGQIFFVNEIQLDSVRWTASKEYFWIGTMEFQGERFIVLQSILTMGGAGLHGLCFYRYGDGGLDLAMEIGLHPAAGPNDDELFCRAMDFGGVVTDERFKPTQYYAGALVAETGEFFVNKTESFGLPNMTSIVYYDDNFKINYTFPTYWGADTLRKSFKLEYDFDSGMLYLEDDTPLWENMEFYGG